ncbi:hypothetical protein [Mucilaginibacter sp.]|uniref:hypothetical protein n=1 Tax=Mucilaginibacter sp. TaxID=1882438 RepID=UPI00261AE6E8|nr:hypothetical protein [Mucilaginibacter sp.]MDB4926391.1 arcB [Mucilaginibacter sp.]
MIFIIQNKPAFGFIDALVSKARMAADILIAKREFVFQSAKKLEQQAVNILINTAEKKKCAEEPLNNSYNENENRKEFLKQYVHGLEEMMFMTHHKVRQPVANILGMVNLIDEYANSPEELKKIVDYMKQSALDLDAFTRELTTFVANLEQRGKNKSS